MGTGIAQVLASAEWKCFWSLPVEVQRILQRVRASMVYLDRAVQKGKETAETQGDHDRITLWPIWPRAFPG
jgi:hypothetical protein